MDTATFLDLSVRRCRGRLAAIRFGACLFVCEIAFCLIWIYNHAPEHRLSFPAWLLFSSLAIDIVWLVTLAFSVLLVWYSRRKRAELASLLELNGELREER
jgi:hypothetical protein